MPLRRLFLFLIFSALLSILYSFFLTSPTHAGSMDICGNTPQYDGPQYNIPFESCNQDCGCPDIGSPRFNDEIDHHSSVACVENPELIAHVAEEVKNKGLLDKIIRLGNGSASYNMQFIDSFAIHPKNQAKLDPAQTNLLLQALNLPDRFDDSLSDALCVYESKFDPEECAAYLQNTLSDGRPNLLGNSWFLSRVQTPQRKFESKKKRLQQIYNCVKGNADDLEPCDQIYTVVKATGETDYKLAEKYKDISYEDYQKLDPVEQMKIRSIRNTRASSPVCIVITREHDPNDPSFWGQIAYHIQLDNAVYYLCGYIPGVAATREASKTMAQLLLSQDRGKTTAEEVTQALNKPATGKTTEEKLMNKVLDSGVECSSFIPDYQSMGSQAPSRTNNDAVNLSWFFSFLAGLTNQQVLDQHMKYVYKAWIIGPTEEIAQYMGKNKNAAIKNIYTRDSTEISSQPIYLPQTVADKVEAATPDNHVDDLDSPHPCPSPLTGTCYDKINAKATFTDGQPVNAGLQGGEGVQNVLMVGHKMGVAKSNSSFFSSMCWAKELSQKLSTSTLLAGTPLFTLIGRTVDAGLNNCPARTSSSNTAISGDVCQIAEANHIDCKMLLGVWEAETAGASSCAPNCWQDPSQCDIKCSDSYIEQWITKCDNNGPYAQGPMQAERAIAERAAPGLSRCQLPDALAIAANILVKEKNSGNPVTTADYSPVGRYSGCNNCLPNDQTQYRWGSGVSYCDAIQQYVNSGSLPSSGPDTSFNIKGMCCWQSGHQVYDKDYCASGQP